VHGQFSPLAHPNAQRKLHLDWSSRFCTAHGSVLSGMPEHVLPVKIASRKEMWTPSNACFLGPTRVHNSNDMSIGSAVLHSSRQCVVSMSEYASPQNCPSPWKSWTPSNIWFLEPTPFHNPNGISIFSAVFAQLTAAILYNEPPVCPSKLPLSIQIWTPI